MIRAVLTVALGMLAASPAAAAPFGPNDRETLLISRARDGGFPNGPSRHAAIAGDYQLASLIAFDSDASNITQGDSNGVSDVFLVRRRKPYSINGEPWRAAGTRLVSRGRGGRPANGPSYLPDLGGDRRHRPRCLAFVSSASNLVAGDTNGVADAFVTDLHSGRIARVSVGESGRQGNGPTTEVQVDGACTRFAFVSRATNLVRRHVPGGRSQVYLRLGRRTALVSAARSGRAGRGDSSEVSLERAGGGGRDVAAAAYSSTAANLSRGDHNRTADVYVTHVIRRGDRFEQRTTLVSRTRGGRAGNGSSDQPDLVAGAKTVAFRTAATNLLPHDRNRATDVALARTARPGRFSLASRSRALAQDGNGDSAEPSAVEPGTNVFFSSDATNLQSTVRTGALFDRNLSGDVFFWSAITGNVSLQSRDSAGEILNNPPLHHHQADGVHVPQAPAEHPVTSYYGNYLLFESSYPLIDLGAASRSFPGLSQHDAAVMSNARPELRQIYLRYIGPR